MLTAAWAAGADNDEYARLARKNSLAQAQLLAHLRDHVEDSGITLRQLRQLREQIYRRCVPEGWTSAFSKQKLTPESVTLYDVMEWYIKPETKPNTCSYIELLVAQVDPRAAPVRSQQPVWFVSHWWGEPVVEFISCIEAHVKDRGLSEDTPYWVCAYANNQHQLDELSDPMQSPFCKALRKTRGTITVLDKEGVTFVRRLDPPGRRHCARYLLCSPVPGSAPCPCHRRAASGVSSRSGSRSFL